MAEANDQYKSTNEKRVRAVEMRETMDRIARGMEREINVSHKILTK